jgi:hypothetical protein
MVSHSTRAKRRSPPLVPFSRRTTDPQVLSKPIPAGYRVDETECLTNTDSDETPLDGVKKASEYSLECGAYVYLATKIKKNGRIFTLCP